MKENKIFYGWWIVLGCILITATIVPPVVALSAKYAIQVTKDLGISRSEFVLTSTLTMAVGIFTSSYASRKLSQGNMKVIQSAAILIFGLAYASYSLAQNQYHLYLSSLIVGISFTFAGLLPVALLINNWFVAKRGFAMSIAMTGIGFGGMIFSQIITKFIADFGWRSSYQYMAIIILVIALPVSLFLFKKKPEDMGLKPYGVEKASANKETATIKDSGVKLSVKESYSKLFFILLLLGMFLNGFVNTGALSNFPPALEELQGPQLAALIISIYSFVGIFGKVILGWINDKYGITLSSAFGCLLFASAFIFIYLGSQASMLYLMGIIFGLGTPIGTVSPPLITSAIFNSEKYPAAMGMVTAVGQIGTTIGGLTIARIYDTTGSYNIAWIILFGLTILTLVFWIAAYRSSKQYS